MNKKAKLAIAIPTYNRCNFLKENISQLLMQLKDIEENVIIIVSDNASTDNTPIIMNELQKLYPKTIFTNLLFLSFVIISVIIAP